jgi:hypothetical protein
MVLIAHKFIACLTLLAMLWVNSNCVCAETRKACPAETDAHSAGSNHEGHDGDHDQEHDHGGCQCVTNVINLSDNGPTLDLKLTSGPPAWVFFDAHFVQNLTAASQTGGSRAPALSLHPPSAETTLLRLHCALIV